MNLHIDVVTCTTVQSVTTTVRAAYSPEDSTMDQQYSVVHIKTCARRWSPTLLHTPSPQLYGQPIHMKIYTAITIYVHVHTAQITREMPHLFLQLFFPPQMKVYFSNPPDNGLHGDSMTSWFLFLFSFLVFILLVLLFILLFVFLSCTFPVKRIKFGDIRVFWDVHKFRPPSILVVTFYLFGWQLFPNEECWPNAFCTPISIIIMKQP